MSQQRYSDDPSAASTTATQHRTGRSNYGGGARTNRRGAANHNHNHNHPHGRGNPIENIGNWIQERRRRHRDRNHGPNGSAADAEGRHDEQSGNHHPVGTEARALQNIRRNAKLFQYPADGFETPIEHSLLYAMIEFPMNYPESVVRKEIDEEDFEVYLYVNEKERRDGGTAADDGGGGDAANASDAYIQSAKNTERRRASYAQLSALLALSAEKNPSKSQAERNTTSSGDNSNKNNNDIPTSSTNSLRLSEGTSHSTIHRSQDNTRSNDNNHTPPTIGQTLCKKLLKTITTYSTRHSLDRASEIREFLSPVEKQCHLKNEKAALQQLLPAYLGYTLSLVTGNPLPLLVGAASLMGKDPMQEENANVNGFRGMGGRVADVERAGLLDECEWEEEG